MAAATKHANMSLREAASHMDGHAAAIASTTKALSPKR
jgi:hypothetical protein